MMTMVARAVHIFEAAPMPDAVRRKAVSMLVANTSRQLRATPPGAANRFAEQMALRPIAEHTDAANAQHYEVPAAFFRECLGPRFKYSCCRYEGAADTLAQAEDRALAETCANAGLADGQHILELGCGWGSLTLWMAAHYPNARITAVSNSHSQRKHIEGEARARNLQNVCVITADANSFETDQMFDRIVSIEMFEHMSNWRALLERCRTWLATGGQMLIHVFAHQHAPYRFDPANREDWVAQHFFAGGVMPSRDLIRCFGDVFTVEREWWWNGKNYERTALDWLKNFDANLPAIRPVLQQTYGRDARIWETRWRLFFLATAGLFGHAGGDEWGVAHYLLRPAA
ncbi:MAG TPA: cyclopropane-fatty-acyl-phospholipid synthase family protein [Vitreimonas sp.]|jgi:cyclopropane-fatty-acyl-phospholipid synthase|nr:cyclopropane-fatty-acyl-phospholipid synthase family protein [Vitreimonas sp.]